MKEQSVNHLLTNRVSWLADSGPEDDIAISSRIRYARNLQDHPFPIQISSEDRLRVMEKVRFAVRESGCFPEPAEFVMSELTPLDRQILLERRLVSREFVSDLPGSVLIVTTNEESGVMVNEEDHLRLQAMRPGFQLREVLQEIDAVDDQLAKYLPYAFDSNLGYLTSCPTNVGTSMRASVMLHLPGLVLENQIHAVIQGVGKLGMAVRGIFGEGSENLGNLYQVSNQSTLGESEKEIIDRLEGVIRQIIGHEKSARKRLFEKRQNFLLDNIGRAYGILKYSYIISSDETLNSLSSLRLGVDMGMFSSVDIHTVNELFIIIQPAHLQKFAGRVLDQTERDVIRANLVRDHMKGGRSSGGKG
jgi:protein arginine kinase